MADERSPDELDRWQVAEWQMQAYSRKYFFACAIVERLCNEIFRLDKLLEERDAAKGALKS